MLRFIVFLFALTSALQCEAQYRNSLQDYYLKKVIDSRRFMRRLSLGFGKHFVPASVQLNYEGWDLKNGGIIKEELNQAAKVKNGYAAYIGSFFPVAVVSDASMLVFNAELGATLATFYYDSLLFQGQKKFVQTYDAIRIGALLSIEYRAGGDIPLNKNGGVMFTLGGGLNPCMANRNDYEEISPNKIMIIPFIKAELGFFAGMAFKIRGIYYAGNSIYANDLALGISDNGVGDMLKTHISGANGFDLALIIMPFSVNWNSDNW